MTRTALALAAALALSSTARAQTPAQPAAAAPAASDAAAIFDRKCDFCHGEDGRGQTKKGKQLKAPDFTSERWQKHTTDAEIVSAITDGVPKHKMPAFKEKLTAEEIASLVPYLRTFAGAPATK